MQRDIIAVDWALVAGLRKEWEAHRHEWWKIEVAQLRRLYPGGYADIPAHVAPEVGDRAEAYANKRMADRGVTVAGSDYV